MNIHEFDYELPADRIAQHPLPERDASRMLLLDRQTGVWEDRQFRELPSLLHGNELIVVNNARVLPARLFGHRTGIHSEAPGKHSAARREFLSAPIEVLLVRPMGPSVWEALVRPGRKIRVGERIFFDGGELQAVVEDRGEYGLRRLQFSPAEKFEALVNQLGHVPLPPYIRRSDEPSDRERYQTIFARQASAVAAPTAALHFSPRIVSQMKENGNEIVEIRLDVGLGTFEPVRTEILEEHKIHRETYEIPEATAAAITAAQRGGRPILAIGTTVVRALEDAAEKAASEHAPCSIRSGFAEASIFLYPGKPFRIVSQLLTNFHLPQSTLLALVCGFAGREHVLAAYRHAVEAGYRFYSYGDCMLIR